MVFSDHEFAQLYQQWEENEEPLPADELPDWDPRKPKPFLNPENDFISGIKSPRECDPE